MVRPVSLASSTGVVVEDLGDGGRRRLLRVVPDRPEIRAAAEAARRVTHDRLVGLHRIESSDDGNLVLILDDVEGESVAARIRRLGAMHEDQVLGLMTSVARGLDRAHAMGIVHGGLRSESILIDEAGEGVLAGLAVDAAIDASGDPAVDIDPGPDDDVIAFARIIMGMLDGVSNPGPDTGRATSPSSADADDPLRSDLHHALRRAAGRVLAIENPRVPRTCGEFLLDVTAAVRAKAGTEAVSSIRPGSAPEGEDDRFSTPVALLALESAIADLVPRRPRLRLADHTAIRTAWEKGEHFLASGSVYKQLQRWQAAGQALEMARAEFEAAFMLDRRLLDSRDRHGRLVTLEASLPRPDHPDARERHARVERMLHPETGDWWLAWEDGRLVDADRVLDEVSSTLSAGRHRDREIESALRLRARWEPVAADCPDRTLDRRFAAEIHDHRGAGIRAGEAFDRGRFAFAGGCWAGRLDRFEEVLAEEAGAHDAAVEARRRWEDARSKVPKARPISRGLREALERMDAEYERIERDVFGVGDFDEAAQSWTAAAASIGGLVLEDVERFGRVETARESYDAVWASTPSRRTCTRLTDAFDDAARRARAATTFRENGEFEQAVSEWTAAGAELRRLLEDDAARHRDALLACERLGRRLEMLPARSLDRSVRADVERARQRYRVMLDWKSAGRFVEVVEAVQRSIESIDRAVQVDASRYQAAVEARDHAARVLLDEPIDVPAEVHDRMRSAQEEIDAIALQAGQAFDLGEYADCADAWRRVVALRATFEEDLERETQRHHRQLKRRELVRWAAVLVLVALAGLVCTAAIGFGRLASQRADLIDSGLFSSDEVPAHILVDRDLLVTKIDGAMRSPVGLLSGAFGVDGFGSRAAMLKRGAFEEAYSWELIDRQLTGIADVTGLPLPFQERLERIRSAVAALKRRWNDGEITSQKLAVELQMEGKRVMDADLFVDMARRTLDTIDEYESHGQRGVTATNDLPEIRRKWEAFNVELASVRESWRQMREDDDLSAVEERLRSLNRNAIDLWNERLRVTADAARREFREVWDDSAFDSIRLAMLEGRRDDVSELDREAVACYENRNYRGAAERWSRATSLAQEAENEHRPAVTGYEQALVAWRDRTHPTRAQKDDREFKAYFNEAETRESEGLAYADDGDFEFADRKLRSAFERWNEGLQRIESIVALRWEAVEDETRSLKDRLADVDWLIRILPAGSEEHRRAVAARDRLRTGQAPSRRHEEG